MPSPSSPSVDPRTPVIVGVGQVSQTPSGEAELHRAGDSVALMARAVDAAATDAGGRHVLDAVGTIAVVGGLWRYHDPGALVAAELGLDDVTTVQTTMGGQIAIHLVGELADRITRGELDVAVVTCGENNLSRRARRRLGIESPRREEAATEVETWGAPLEMGNRTAIERGAEHPRNTYAVLDSALRAARGETLDEARTRAAELWAGYAAVAVSNPHAADRSGPDAEAIRTATPDNRFVSWPYTKAMCANNNVDHGGALILCSTETADRLGVPPDRRVHPHRCVLAQDTPSFTGRHDAATAPGLAAAAAELRRTEGDLDGIEHLDLYACFPSIVRLTTELFEISADRPLTVTGGLAFAGAALNFASGESLIGMVDTLRADPGSRGLVQGNGGHAAKHAIGVYSTEPPSTSHHITAVSHDAPSRPEAEPDRSGAAVLDGVTVEYAHEGPSRALGLVRFEDGSRTWANSTDPATMAAITREELVGTAVDVDAGVFTPA